MAKNSGTPPSLGANHAMPQQFKHGKNGRADVNSKSFKRKKKALYKLVNDFYKS